jgi:lipoprotein NlpI
MPATRTRWSRLISGRADVKAGLQSRLYGAVHAAVALLALASPALAQRDVPTRALLENAIDEFLAGRVKESVVLFDRVATQAPEIAPELWQRGIALYYAGRDRDCRAQFESHRTVNPNDVENPAWHFLCVARLESPERARKALLPVGPDQRSPMREVYQMFQGTLAPDRVLAVAGSNPSARFYAELYVGLYYEATRERAKAIEHLKLAASPQYARIGGYMHRVAELHPLLQK